MRRLRLLLALGGLLLLVACAPTLQKPLQPEPGFAGPRLETRDFVSFDGAKLPIDRWDSRTGAPWAVIVGVHGFNDYANAFHLAAPWWAERGVTTYAYDQRGYGRTPERGVWAPDALRVADLRTMVGLVRARYPGAIVAVAGESLGGAVAIEAFASTDPPKADRLILLAPAVWGWTSQPITYRAALWAAAKLAPGHVFTPPSWLTSRIYASDNIAELRAMGRDPLMIWGARSDALFGLVSAMQTASREAADLKIPTLWQYGAHDEIIPPHATLAALRGASPTVRTAWYRDGWHLLLRDRHADQVWADDLAFLRDPEGALPSGAPALSASLFKRRGRAPSAPPAPVASLSP